MKLKSIVNMIFKLISLSVISIIFLGIYITFIERNLLMVKRHNINISKNGEDKLKVVQITDTQLGEYYSLENLNNVVKKINNLNPDIVVFTGDLIDNAATYEDLYNVSEVLGKIETNIGKYAVYGNHDIGGGAIRYYEDIMSEAGFTVLKNNKETIEVNGKYISIFGGDEALLGRHNSEETMRRIDEENVNILLIHEPDLIEEYIDYPIDLVLSGHSHGGQVYIPFYGPIVSNALAEKYSKGLYKIDNYRQTNLYVSSGLGNTKLPFRFFNIPEIVVFDLKI